MTPQILVATDFSDEAEAALRVAIDHARRVGARLHIFHVLSGAEVEVTSLLADATALAGPDVPVTVASTRGDPAAEILRYARGHAIDLIVLGTHGRTGFSRALLGSVADRVLRGAACPVLAVPPRALARVTGTERPPEADVDEPPSPACLVCARPSRDLICEPCRARIRGEALERKQRQERPGRP
jgi:nucleotide-binding universal stress UspA family protein